MTTSSCLQVLKPIEGGTPHDKIGPSTEIVRRLQEGLDVGARCVEDEDGESARTHRWRRHEAPEDKPCSGRCCASRCASFRTFHRPAWCLQLHGRRHPHGRDETRHAIECGYPAGDTPHIITRRTLKQQQTHYANCHILRETLTPSSVSHLADKFHHTANKKNKLLQPTSRDHLTLLSGAFTRPRRVNPSRGFSTNPLFLTFRHQPHSRRVMTSRSQTSDGQLVLPFPVFGRLSSAKEKIAHLATHVGTNVAMALPIQVCGSQNTGSQTVVQHSLRIWLSFTSDSLF